MISSRFWHTTLLQLWSCKYHIKIPHVWKQNQEIYKIMLKMLRVNELHLKKISRWYSLETFLCSCIYIKLGYLRVKSAYEGGKKCVDVILWKIFYNRIKCNCGENITTSYILQAFIRLLQCDDERRQVLPLMPINLFLWPLLYTTATKLSVCESSRIHKRLNVFPLLAQPQNEVQDSEVSSRRC